MEPDDKKILISNDSRVSEIQHQFSACYPFLKIEFYATGSKAKNGQRIPMDPLTSLKQLANIKPGAIDINRNKTVAEISNYIQEILGVIVKVRRKSGSVWITISLSDGWTLQSQNTAAEFICSQMATNESSV